MDIETKIDLAGQAPVEEVITRDDLRALFETNTKPGHYLGIEISGLLHIGSLFANGTVFNNLARAGVKTQVFLADWHSFLNKKFGGDWDAIHEASKYYEEAFKLFCPDITIRRGTELYEGAGLDFWRDVMRFSTHVTMARATRAMTILGRSEKETLAVAQYIYPPLQGVDIHYLGADIAHAGMDQRKIHVLAREIYPKMGWKAPVCLHHHLLAGLSEPPQADVKAGETADKSDLVAAAKMSKSKPDSAIFIHDSTTEIKRKLSKAYCPPATTNADGAIDTHGNPVLDWAKWLIYAQSDVKKRVLNVERPAKFGGNVTFTSYAELEAAYAGGKLHAMDLKSGMANAIDALVAPVRAHFEKPAFKKLLDVYGKVQITR